MTGRILIDGHVHLYPSARLDRAFAAALRNQTAAAGPGTAEHVLLLTETARDHAFAELRKDRVFPEGWSVQVPPADAAALILTGPGGARLMLVAGRQIVSAEGVEVLSIGSDSALEDRRPLTEMLSYCDDHGLPAILPWGLGKWIGRRGTLLREMIEAGPPFRFALGDNAGRPVGWRRPPLFALARSQGIPILPGTDPLPIPRAEEGIGRYGFALGGALDPDRPAAELVRRLRLAPEQPDPFGARRSWPQVVTEQIALRRNKKG